jgi:putative spermidine/putrescine transport system permease protein
VTAPSADRVWLAAGALYAALVAGALAGVLAFALAVSLNPSSVLGLPTTGLSLRWYRELAASAVWRHGLGNSLLVAGASTALALVIGGASALAAHRSSGRRAIVVEASLVAPLLTPGIALGLGLLVFFRWVGLAGTYWALAVGHALVSAPVVFLVLRGTLAGIDPRLEEAARGLGASPWRSRSHVTLPLALPGVVVAAIFAVVLSIGEVVISLLVATPGTQTLSKVIWPNLQYELTPIVAAASGVLLLVAAALVGLAAYVVRPGRLAVILRGR